ncbi:MAG: helix-turn-helix domain-containing protein [Armatimonadota bacterium]|nr:helix-turn-helix domain-containing protein [Armatimonadota bacterium]
MKELVIRSSGNVFADLDFENAQEELAKADLVIAIAKIIRSRRLTQSRVANEIGLDQPQVSRLLRGHTEGYSTGRLLRILNLLGQDVEIRVRPKRVGAAHGRVTVASRS